MAVFDKIISLTRQLYPTGRAFKMPVDGYLEALHKGLGQSESRAWADAVSIFDNILPDNDNFTEQDATDWENRLGLITAEGVSLADRKLAIKRKINFPGAQPARQHYLFLQNQLQAAGFNVYVFENRFSDGMGGYTTQAPLDITAGVGSVGAQHGDFQHGDFQHGAYYNNIIANHIDEDIDIAFNVGLNLRSTFFIGDNPLGSFIIIDAKRKDEFRQLILKLKPAQTVGFLFVNYV